MKPEKQDTYRVTVQRLQPQKVTLNVTAESPEEATQKTLAECGSHVFTSDGCAYDEEVTECQKK